MNKAIELAINTRNISWQTIAKLPLAFENPTGTERPLWRDYSKHQGLIDFDVAKAGGVLGMVARSSISWGYKDQFFDRNYQEAGRVGMYRSSYQVLYPSEPVIRQADNWYKAHPEIDKIPRWLDAELQHDSEDEQVAESIWDFSELVKSRDGIRFGIYGRYKQLGRWLKYWTEDMINDHYYFLAQYLWDRVREHPGEPTLFDRLDRSRVLIHQAADLKPGFRGEAQSLSVDWDRWELGNNSDMHNFIATTWGGENNQEPPPPDQINKDLAISELLKTQVEINSIIDHRVNNLNS